MPHLESLEDRSLLTGPGALGGYSYATLQFPSEYNNDTTASGINDFGQVVGSYESISNDMFTGGNGFLLTGGKYITLDFPGAVDTAANGISNSGSVVGSYVDASGDTHGFRLFAGGYSTIDFPGATSTVPLGINNSGQIVGFYSFGINNEQGFLRNSAGIYTTLHFAGATSTIPMGINDSGQIVGEYLNVDGGGNGFLLSGGIYTTIDFPGEGNIPYGTYLTGINDSGQIVGVVPDYNEFNLYPAQGFLLSGGNYLTIDIPGTTTSYPAGINDSGQIVGTDATESGIFNSFIANPDTLSATTTTIRSGPSPSNHGQTVTFSSQVVNANPDSTAEPTGSVQFYVDGQNYGAPVPLNAHGAALLTDDSLSAGTHKITAGFLPNDNKFSGSLSGTPATQVVEAAETTTTISSGPSPSNYGQTVTFDAQVVTSSPNSTAKPTGSVQFYVDRGKYGAPVPLNADGVAVISDDSLPAGTHEITATFIPADMNFIASLSSTPATQVVKGVVSPNLVQISASGLVYNRSTRLFGGTITVTNISTSTIGVLELELTGLPPGVSVANASGTAADGNPYLLVNSPDGILLAPGQSITLTVLFSNPTKVSFQYGVSVLS